VKEKLLNKVEIPLLGAKDVKRIRDISIVQAND
jgi:hypothetical protein